MAPSESKLFVELFNITLPDEPEPDETKLAVPAMKSGPDCETAPLAVIARLMREDLPRSRAPFSTSVRFVADTSTVPKVLVELFNVTALPWAMKFAVSLTTMLVVVS